MTTKRLSMGLLFNCAIAIAFGCMLAIVFGTGRPSPPARTTDQFAQVENIRLPSAARTATELKSLVIRVGGEPDDFARIYVNNRLVTSTDYRYQAFRYINEGWEQKKRDDFLMRFAANRPNPTAPEVETRGWLRVGINWIMVELENSRWGACSMTFEIRANGTQLEGSPYFIPQREPVVDADLFNPHLLQRLKKLSDETVSIRDFGIMPEYDAVCARRLFAFRLK